MIILSLEVFKITLLSASDQYNNVDIGRPCSKKLVFDIGSWPPEMQELLNNVAWLIPGHHNVIQLNVICIQNWLTLINGDVQKKKKIQLGLPCLKIQWCGNCDVCFI